MPRSAAGTLVSAMEKSRTDSSWIWIRAGGTGAGFGQSGGRPRSTIWLCVESAASETEYGSVTDAVTTRRTAGCQTVTR